MRNNTVAYLFFLLGICLSCFFGSGVTVTSVLPSAFCFFLGCVTLFFPFTDSSLSRNSIFRIGRFPPFYFLTGLLLIALFQVLNPSAEYVKVANSWFWLPISSIDYLPTSVLAPIEKGYSEDLCLMLVACWFLTMLAFVVLDSKQRIFIVFATLFSLCVIVSILFIFQKFSGIKLFFWNTNSGASSINFYYHAQGNSFLIMMMGVAAYLFYISNSLFFRIFCAFGIVVFYISILLSGGFGGIILASVALFILILLSIRHYIWKFIFVFTSVVSITVIVLLLPMFPEIYNSSPVQRVISKMENVENVSRIRSKEVTFQMLKDEVFVQENKKYYDISALLFGKGINSYMSMCELYSIKNGKMRFPQWAILPTYSVPGYAHCDIMQILFEFGLIGFLLVVLWGIYFFITVYKSSPSKELYYLIIPLCIVFIYSLNDIILYNTYVDFLLIVIQISILSSIQLDSSWRRIRKRLN